MHISGKAIKSTFWTLAASTVLAFFLDSSRLCLELHRLRSVRSIYSYDIDSLNWVKFVSHTTGFGPGMQFDPNEHEKAKKN